MTITPANARGLAAIGIDILAAANKGLGVRHPDNPAIRGISYVMFCTWEDDGHRIMRNATILIGLAALTARPVEQAAQLSSPCWSPAARINPATC